MPNRFQAEPQLDLIRTTYLGTITPAELTTYD
jgi:hypothetical protein